MQISDKFIISKVADQNVILPIDEDVVSYNSVFMLNETAMFIVSCMPASSEQIVQQLVINYELSTDEATAYLNKFVAKLLEYGIIE